jgi:hypothetical protein
MFGIRLAGDRTVRKRGKSGELTCHNKHPRFHGYGNAAPGRGEAAFCDYNQTFSRDDGPFDRKQASLCDSSGSFDGYGPTGRVEKRVDTEQEQRKGDHPPFRFGRWLKRLADICNCLGRDPWRSAAWRGGNCSSPVPPSQESQTPELSW